MTSDRSKITSSVHALVGQRSPRDSIRPESLISEIHDTIPELRQYSPKRFITVKKLKASFAQVCRLYYTAAAVSRRTHLPDELRAELLGTLFIFRRLIERSILDELVLLGDQHDLWCAVAAKSFFGVSAKQGVSIRYALASCIPTESCGGRCYAHDGRDRELHIMFRAVFNYFAGLTYESGDTQTRLRVMKKLTTAIDYGIKSAVAERSQAMKAGFNREARIRFSHIGEMPSTPCFTNDLAREINSRNKAVACVIYTRHPNVTRLDPGLFRINVSLETLHDSRRDLAPPGVRFVSSAWDGKLDPNVTVNFLEHHVEKHSNPTGIGNVCPVTMNAGLVHSCDEACCDLCFGPIEDAVRTSECK